MRTSQKLNDEVAKFTAMGKGSVVSKAADHILSSTRQKDTVEKFVGVIRANSKSFPSIWIAVSKDNLDIWYLFFADTEQEVLDRLGPCEPPKPLPQTTIAKMLYKRIKILKSVAANEFAMTYHLDKSGLNKIIVQDINTVAKLTTIVEGFPRWCASRALEAKTIRELKQILAKYPVSDAAVQEAWNLQAVNEVMAS
jgi:hypothetical protein